MIFSNPSEYAIRALSEMAVQLHDPEATKGRRPGYIMLDRLTESAALPREFLAKIFRQLVEARVLKSAKGPGGGFSFARPPAEISLLDIVEAVDGHDMTDICVVGLSRCDDSVACAQHELFKPIRQQLKSYLTNTTLADTSAALIEKKNNPPKVETKPTKGGK